MKSKYFSKLKEKKVKCELCPHICIINDQKLGLCKNRKNEDGTLKSKSYGYLSSISIDPIEKKPLFHFYPKSETLSIGGYGCNLLCDFCQNWQISTSEVKKDNFYKPKEIINLAKSKNTNIISYTYNEPLINYEYVYKTSKAAKKNDLKNVIVSNGFINKEPIKEISKYIDAANIDLKGDNNFYKNITGGLIKPVKDTIKILKKNDTWIEITFLLIEGLNDNIKFLAELRDFIEEIGDETPLHITRYFPRYKLKNDKTTVNRMLEVKKYFEEKLKYVYLGNVNLKKSQDTYCPKCKEIVIKRGYYQTEIINNNCISEIDGFF